MAEVKTAVLSEETLVIDVVRNKSGMGRGVGKFFAYIIGGTGILLSSILFLTIIGIPIAFGLFFLSIGLIYLAQGRQQVACPHCKKKQPVLQTAENMVCPKCRKITVIDWK
jgi:hypothetical protein